WGRWLVLAAVQTLFLLSVGFQPLIFLFCATLVLAPLLLRPSGRRQALLILASSAAALAAASPVLALSAGAPTFYSERRSALTMAGRVLAGLGSVSPGRWAEVLQSLLLSYTGLFVLAVGWGAYEAVRARAEGRSAQRRVFLVLLGFAMVFP